MVPRRVGTIIDMTRIGGCSGADVLGRDSPAIRHARPLRIASPGPWSAFRPILARLESARPPFRKSRDMRPAGNNRRAESESSWKSGFSFASFSGDTFNFEWWRRSLVLP